MFLFLSGLGLAIVYAIIVLPRNEGESPLIRPNIHGLMWKGMIIIPVSEMYAIHLHHWMIYCVIFFGCVLLNKFHFVMGFSMGLMIQGLMYHDSFILFCDNPFHSVKSRKFVSNRIPFHIC